MTRALACWLLIACSATQAGELQAGRLNQFKVSLPPELRTLAGRGQLSPVTHALATVAVPKHFSPRRDWPIMIVCATTDQGRHSSRALLDLYAPVALERGWILVAADPAGEQVADDMTLRLALDLAALAALETKWPGAAHAPLAFGGFSGGAKCSGWLGAAFTSSGRRVIGLYLAGINEDTVSAPAKSYKVLTDTYRRTPVFLQAGDADTVASVVDHRKVAGALEDAGFRNVHVEYFHGGHEVDAKPLGIALDWFRQLAGALGPAP
jgi:predicted esterase